MKGNLALATIGGIALASIVIFIILSEEDKQARISEEVKQARISEIEFRLEEIKEIASESKRYLFQYAYYECRTDIPRYTSGLTSQEYFEVVDNCYSVKVASEAEKLEKLTSEKTSLTAELNSLVLDT